MLSDQAVSDGACLPIVNTDSQVTENKQIMVIEKQRYSQGNQKFRKALRLCP